LPVPENLMEQLKTTGPDDFFIDPDIPIPVEVCEDGETGSPGKSFHRNNTIRNVTRH